MRVWQETTAFPGLDSMRVRECGPVPIREEEGAARWVPRGSERRGGARPSAAERREGRECAPTAWADWAACERARGGGKGSQAGGGGVARASGGREGREGSWTGEGQGAGLAGFFPFFSFCLSFLFYFPKPFLKRNFESN